MLTGNWINALTAVLVTSLTAFNASAQSTDYVDVADGHRVFYRVEAPKGEPKGTVLLFGGLLYADSAYEDFLREKLKRGYRIIHFDYSTRPVETTGLATTPYFLRNAGMFGMPNEQGTDLKTLATDGLKVLEHLGIKGDVTLIGFSFGGFVATTFAKLYPHKVNQLLLMVPAIRPTQTYNPLLASTGTNAYFEMGRFNPAIDYQYRMWLRSIIYTIMQSRLVTVGDSYLPKGVSMNSLADSTYHLVRTVRYEDLKQSITEVVRDLPVSVLLTTEEPGPFRQDQLEFVKVLEKAEFEKLQLVEVKGAHHILTEFHPELSAKLTDALIQFKYSAQFTQVLPSKESRRLTPAFCEVIFSK